MGKYGFLTDCIMYNILYLYFMYINIAITTHKATMYSNKMLESDIIIVDKNLLYLILCMRAYIFRICKNSYNNQHFLTKC